MQLRRLSSSNYGLTVSLTMRLRDVSVVERPIASQDPLRQCASRLKKADRTLSSARTALTLHDRLLHLNAHVTLILPQ